MGLKIDKKSFRQKYVKDKEKHPPMGLRIYTAPQGGGKTLSMVHDALALMEEFPKMKVVSNLDIKTDKPIYKFQGTGGLRRALVEAKNGVDGVLMIIDEFQLFASKKSGVPLEIFQQLCQQRKQRRFMMGTAQDWEDVDVSTRKKVAEIVQCRTIWRKIQVNRVFDGTTVKWDKQANAWVCSQLRTEIFKHNQKLYDSYNTFAEISTNMDMFVAPKAREVAVSVEVVQRQQGRSRLLSR